MRLLYVAATRAKDHLVVNMHYPDRGNCFARQIANLLEAADPGLWNILDRPPLPDRSAVPDAPSLDIAPMPAAADFLPQRERWQRQRGELIKAAARPPSAAATTLARIAKEESGDTADDAAAAEPWRRGRGGAPLGRAVHAVLQTIDLATGAGLAETAQSQALGENIPGRRQEIIDLAQVALDSAAVRQAVASGRYWREVPVAAPLGKGSDGIIEGFIDLLYETPDGSLVVVDYKTDAIDAAETAETVQRYRLQGGAYALALQQATGKPVREVVFLFLRPSKEERLTNIPELTAAAAELAAAHLG